MPASPYSKRFMLGNETAAGTETVTVPAGYVWSVKWADFASTVANAQVALEVNGIPVWAGVCPTPVAGDYGHADYDGGIVLSAGETLGVAHDAHVAYQVSGFQLTAAP